MLVPKLFTTLPEFTRRQVLADVGAGVVVGVVALPLAIAFAIASGVSPEAGLWTAIVAGFLISTLGGSRVQIGGPTGAFVVIVYEIVQSHGVAGLQVATLMAGMILIALGIARLGAAIKFIPYPVTTGFTSGIAVLIFSGQVKDFLGLEMGSVPAGFVDKWQAYAAHLGSLNPAAFAVGAGALAILLLWPRLVRSVPAPAVALVATTAVVRIFDLPVETIGDRFGEIRASLPELALPRVAMAEIPSLVGPAFTIALLGGIESLLSAVVADGMIGGRHRSNMELVAQGIANVASPLVGGIPATGAIARTATNVKSGGRTPVAGIVHALTLLVITLFLAPWAALIPLAALAAILFLVAYHMSEWRRFVAEFRAPKSDIAVLVSTFALTLFVDLTVAVEVGVVLAAFLFMRRMAEVTNVHVVTRELEDGDGPEADDPNAVGLRVIPPGVEVFEIDGPFFFGAAESFRDAVSQIGEKPRVLIFRLRHVPAVDSTGLHAIAEMASRAKHEGTLVLLSEIHSQPLVALQKNDLYDELGAENVLATLDDALQRAREALGLADAPGPPARRRTPPGG